MSNNSTCHGFSEQCLEFSTSSSFVNNSSSLTGSKSFVNLNETEIVSEPESEEQDGYSSDSVVNKSLCFACCDCVYLRLS